MEADGRTGSGRDGDEPMMTLAQTVAVALVIGALCGLLRLPLPAPSTLAGVAGVVALFAGWHLVRQLLGIG